MSKRRTTWTYRGGAFTHPGGGLLSQAELLDMGITRNKTFRYERNGTITVRYHGGRRFFTPGSVKAMKGK